MEQLESLRRKNAVMKLFSQHGNGDDDADASASAETLLALTSAFGAGELVHRVRNSRVVTPQDEPHPLLAKGP